MNTNPCILIFSVFQKALGYAENYANHVDLLLSLHFRGIEAVELFGAYNGTEEYSILVLDTPENRALVEHYTEKFSQECYLESDAARHTYLVAPGGVQTYVGVLQATPKEEALASGNYSYNKQNHTYYTTRVPAVEAECGI